MIKMRGLLCVLCVVITASVVAAAPKLAPLGTYTVDTGNISISGLSSGGYFTVQFHVAFSKTIMGAGVIAGGPYYCAEGQLTNALVRCMTSPATIDVKVLEDKMRGFAASGDIDDTNNIKGDKVYLYSGTKDTVVDPGVMKKLEQFYQDLGVDIETEFTIPSEHSMVTNDYGNSCGHLGTPYINNCNYSTPYHILSHIYGDITDADTSASIKDNLLEFDQTEFYTSLTSSIDSTGFLYVPKKCQNKEMCRLHVAFHGCLQGRVELGTEYALHTEYNGLAEKNDFIILYPQVQKEILYNPNGCWDWWGYTSGLLPIGGNADYVKKDGIQMAAVMAMIQRLTGQK